MRSDSREHVLSSGKFSIDRSQSCTIELGDSQALTIALPLHCFPVFNARLDTDPRHTQDRSHPLGEESAVKYRGVDGRTWLRCTTSSSRWPQIHGWLPQTHWKSTCHGRETRRNQQDSIVYRLAIRCVVYKCCCFPTPPWEIQGQTQRVGTINARPHVTCSSPAIWVALSCMLLQTTARPPLECSHELTMESRQAVAQPETRRRTTNSRTGHEDCRGMRSFVQIAYTDFVSSRARVIAASVQRTRCGSRMMLGGDTVA
jgi:hypothetical protein